MTRENLDEKTVLKDFKEAFKHELQELGKEEQEKAVETFAQHFEEGFGRVQQHRHALNQKQAVLRFIHEAKIQVHNARLRDVKTHFPHYVEELGRGLGELMAVIEYACFRNQWTDDAETLRKHLVPVIQLLDRTEHQHHHKKIRKRVKKIMHHDTTPEERQLGAAIIDAFR
ncbi:hypothetical protein GF367_03265 [Candidatus Woesearchaeota archaeon]|nr:hypothetical protein [Candidatus Woesearchaeota archaeon]